MGCDHVTSAQFPCLQRSRSKESCVCKGESQQSVDKSNVHRQQVLLLHPLSSRRGPKRWVLADKAHTTEHKVSFKGSCVCLGLAIMGRQLRFATGTTRLKSEFSKTQRSVGAAEYQSILNDTLLPQTKQLFGRHSISDWTFQQDGAPATQLMQRRSS